MLLNDMLVFEVLFYSVVGCKQNELLSHTVSFFLHFFPANTRYSYLNYYYIFKRHLQPSETKLNICAALSFYFIRDGTLAEADLCDVSSRFAAAFDLCSITLQL